MFKEIRKYPSDRSLQGYARFRQAEVRALKWLRTPFRHKARVLGHGIDCLGLVLVIADRLDLDEEYPRARRPQELLQRFLEHGSLVSDCLEPLDILVFNWQGTAHCGIYMGGEQKMFYHARLNKCALSQEYTRSWQDRTLGAVRWTI